MAQYSYSLNEGVLLETQINGRPVDIVIDQITFVDGQPFMTGIYSANNGSEKEIAMPLRADEVPNLEGLKNAERQKILTSGFIEQSIPGHLDEMIMSTGKAFPDKDRLLQDVIKLSAMGEGTDHIRSLALLGQQYPDFVNKLDKHLNQGMGSDTSIKLAILDVIGIKDIQIRESLVFRTGDLDEFTNRISTHVDLDNRDTLKAVLAEIGDRSKSLFEKAAEEAKAVAEMAKAAKWSRLGGHVPALGVASAVAGVALTGAASAAQIDYASTLAAEGKLTPDALAGYQALNQNAQLMMAADTTFNAADASGFAIISTLGVEAQIRESFESWADQYAPNLSNADFDALAMSMLPSTTARNEMFLSAAHSIPSSLEGQPEVLQDVILARQEYLALLLAEGESFRMLMNANMYGGSGDNGHEFVRITEAKSVAESKMIDSMDVLMQDPEKISVFLDLIPVDQRMDYVRRLAESDPNPDVMAAIHPEIAHYVAAYEGANIFQTRIFGFDADSTIRDNPELLNAYIIDRSGLKADEAPSQQSLNELIAGAEIPDSAPPELQAFAALARHPEAQKSMYNEMKENGSLAIISSYFQQEPLENVEPQPQLASAAVAPVVHEVNPVVRQNLSL